jgi:hypothetical protein
LTLDFLVNLPYLEYPVSQLYLGYLSVPLVQMGLQSLPFLEYLVYLEDLSAL